MGQDEEEDCRTDPTPEAVSGQRIALDRSAIRDGRLTCDLSVSSVGL
jgi:hypothetical protein